VEVMAKLRNYYRSEREVQSSILELFESTQDQIRKHYREEHSWVNQQKGRSRMGEERWKSHGGKAYATSILLFVVSAPSFWGCKSSG
jgi:hypothetical protein